jgi:hypothetical protein
VRECELAWRDRPLRVREAPRRGSCAQQNSRCGDGRAPGRSKPEARWRSPGRPRCQRERARRAWTRSPRRSTACSSAPSRSMTSPPRRPSGASSRSAVGRRSDRGRDCSRHASPETQPPPAPAARPPSARAQVRQHGWPPSAHESLSECGPTARSPSLLHLGVGHAAYSHRIPRTPRAHHPRPAHDHKRRRTDRPIIYGRSATPPCSCRSAASAPDGRTADARSSRNATLSASAETSTSSRARTRFEVGHGLPEPRSEARALSAPESRAAAGSPSAQAHQGLLLCRAVVGRSRSWPGPFAL